MKKYIQTIAAVLLFVVVAIAPLKVLAAPSESQSAVCDGAEYAGASVDCADSKLSDDQAGGIFRSIINILSVVVGAVSVIMIIVGGFRYIVSNGDSNAVSGAKNTILYAIVGLVIVLFAQVIIRFVLTTLQNKTN